MPKQLYKIIQFHGGLNSNSDARDIAENELSDATDVMVDELGKIRMMGGIAAQVAGTPEDDQATGWAGTLVSGYGLFQTSRDRVGFGNISNYKGQHDGSDGASTLSDGGASFEVDALIGGIVYNLQDESSGVITDNDGTTITATLAGGQDNDWDDNDHYSVLLPETGDDHLLIYDDHDQQVWAYSRTKDAWEDDNATADSGIINIGSDSGAKPVFYSVDGVLRVCDGNFGNTNKWYGYIYRYRWQSIVSGSYTRDYSDGHAGGWLRPLHGGGVGFPGEGTFPADHALEHYNGWHAEDQAISPPTHGLLGVENDVIAGTTTGGTTTTIIDTGNFSNLLATDIDGKGYIAVAAVNAHPPHAAEIISKDDDNTLTTASTSDWYVSGIFYTILPPAGTGFNLFIVNDGDNSDSGDSNWPAGNYEMAASFIYDNNQESLLYKYPHYITLSGDDTHYPKAFIYLTPPYNPRITGGRIYIRQKGESQAWVLHTDISLEKGGRASIDVDYSGFIYNHILPAVGPEHLYLSVYKDLGGKYNNPLTYEVLSGISEEETSIIAKFKTAVVANRMVYIGNVESEDSDGNKEVRGDAIIKSPVNKFDTFPLSRIIEATVRDGDEIVKLEEYADRILQFKKNKMQLINVSQEVEFLEDTFMYKGVSHPAATCKTDFGIAWVNKQGCYLYDGQKVSNLLEKAGRQIIKESTWATFTANEPMIGYIPKKRQLIVADDITTSGDGATFLYDMVTQSWVKGSDDTITAQAKTNFITDWNGDLVYAHTAGTVVKWDDDGKDSTAFVITTKDIDFGQPGQKKKIYKVYVTYTGVDSLSVNVDYQINGDNGWNGFASGEPLTGNTASGQNEATLTLSSPVECYSFQLRFSGTGKTTFEINDATIVFRLKGQR